MHPVVNNLLMKHGFEGTGFKIFLKYHTKICALKSQSSPVFYSK